VTLHLILAIMHMIFKNTTKNRDHSQRIGGFWSFKCYALYKSTFYLLTYFIRGMVPVSVLNGFYRAMHFSAKRGIAIACRLSVRPSVCL